MERLFQAKLDRLEAEYAETILVGERAALRRAAEQQSVSDVVYPIEKEDSVFLIEEKSVSEDKKNCNEELFRPVDMVALTTDEILQIKAHMATIRPKFEPTWARTVSDAQLVAALKKLAE